VPEDSDSAHSRAAAHGRRKEDRRPVAPYIAVGLSTVVYGVAERRHIRWNLETIEDAIHAAMSIIGINMPIKLVTLAEGALTGFTDEAFDVPHVVATHDLFIDIPGEETETLARLAKHYETYIVGQCKARWPEVMPNRYFNTLFVISPEGEIVHKAAKNHLWCRERSCTPHDVYDRWVELFGDGIGAFYPVLRTEDIGNLGTICCSDGEYPEAVRALALNGAEVVYRPSEAVPMTNTGSERGGTWLLQNRAHAHFNSVYMLCPNVGPVYLHPKMRHPIDIGGGNSHIVDYLGNVLSHSASGYNTFVSAIVDVGGAPPVSPTDSIFSRALFNIGPTASRPSPSLRSATANTSASAPSSTSSIGMSPLRASDSTSPPARSRRRRADVSSTIPA